jgi:uncharacterized protein (UPF0335 family)
MGHVRLTPDLQRDIQSRVLKPFVQRVEAITESITKDPVLIKTAYHSIVSVELMNYLNGAVNKDSSARQWIRTADTLKLQIITPSNRQLIFGVSPTEPVPVPMNFSPWNVWLVIRSTHPAYEIVRERIEKLEAVESEMTKLHNDLFKPVFSNCNTVKQAVKIWPSIVDFLHPAAREQFYSRPSQQSRTSVDLEGIEIDEDAKHLLTKARMLTQ